MKRLASLLSLFLLATMPCLGQDARGESDFLDMVGQSDTGSSASVGKVSCETVDLSAVLAQETGSKMETLLMGLAVRPEDPALHNLLGNYYAERSLWSEAENAYRCALALDESLSMVWNNLGIVHMGQQDATAAISVLKRATKLDDSYALAFYNLGMAYDQAERLAPALDAYERAITLDPKLATIAHNPQVAGNPHQTVLFLRRLQHNAVALSTSLDE